MTFHCKESNFTKTPLMFCSPQPFEASTVKLNETPLGFSAPFYIDRSRFIANIDKVGVHVMGSELTYLLR